MKSEQKPAGLLLYKSVLIPVIFLTLLFICPCRPAGSAEGTSAAAESSEKELKQEEKMRRKNLKKLEEMKAPMVPFEAASMEEKKKREEGAKERLAAFQQEVEKKREAERLREMKKWDRARRKQLEKQKKELEGAQREQRREEGRLERERKKQEGADVRKEEERRSRLIAEKARLLKELELAEQGKGETPAPSAVQPEEREIKKEQRRMEEEKSRLERERLAAEARRIRLEEKERKRLEKENQKREARRLQEAEKERIKLEKERAKEEKRRRLEEERSRRLEEKRRLELEKKRKEEPPPAVRTAQTTEEIQKAVNFHLAAAQRYLDRGATTSARFHLEKVLRSEPQNEIAKNLMTVAVTQDYLADLKGREFRTLIAQKIESEEMRNKFNEMMDRIDRDITRLTAEGDRRYRGKDFTAANESYRQVIALETERQMITEELIQRLEKRVPSEPAGLSAREKAGRIRNLLRDGARLEEKADWEGASASYEAVFALDPLNPEASRAIDRLKQRFLEKQKQNASLETVRVEEKILEKKLFYLGEASNALGVRDYERAKVFAEKALALEPGSREARRILDAIAKQQTGAKP